MFYCLCFWLWKANFSGTRPPTCSYFLSRFFGMKRNCADINLVSWWACSRIYCLLLSACLHLHQTPPEQTHYTNPACLWLKSFCYVFVFFHVCVVAVPPRGEQTCDSWVQGECIILVCCRICCGQVFITLSWLHGHCERACQWRDGCMYYESCEQAWSNLLLGRDPFWLIIMGESLTQEGKIWKPLLSNNMHRCV